MVKDNWHKHELIGKQVVAKYNKKEFVGKVIDETKETVVISDQHRQLKTLIKKDTIIIKINDKEVQNKKINLRPHERIKLK